MREDNLWCKNVWKVGKDGIEGTGERLALDGRKHTSGMPGEERRKKWADTGAVGGLVLDVEEVLIPVFSERYRIKSAASRAVWVRALRREGRILENTERVT